MLFSKPALSVTAAYPPDSFSFSSASSSRSSSNSSTQASYFCEDEEKMIRTPGSRSGNLEDGELPRTRHPSHPSPRLPQARWQRKASSIGLRALPTSRKPYLAVLGGLFLASILYAAFSSGADPHSSWAKTQERLKSPWSAWPASKTAESATVPNIAHFVILGDAPVFQVTLSTWLGVWSCKHWMAPEKILIHTNHNESVIQQARQFPPDHFTAALLRIPSLEFSHVEPAHASSTGVEFTGGWAHASDFIRTKALATHGGVYLDGDSYLLRDVTPLRKTGFQMVVGQQHGGAINVAAFFATPGNVLMTTFESLINKVYNGSWGRHSFELLSRLVQIFAQRDGVVLVLPQDSLFPLSWERDDMVSLYKPLGSEVARPVEAPRWETSSAAAATDKFVWGQWDKHSPVIDWSSSFVLHGWNAAIYDDARMSAAERAEWFGQGEPVLNLDYLLRRDSNFASAVWPALRAAILEGNLAITEVQRAAFDRWEH